MNKILFDVTQRERGKIQSTYKILQEILSEKYIVESYNDYIITSDKICDVSLIVFACPSNSKLREHELSTLQLFVQAGGSILLLSHSGSDKGLGTNLNALSSRMGIEFVNDSVTDINNNNGTLTNVTISEIRPHRITSGINEIQYPSGCTLSVRGNAMPVMFTSSNASPPDSPIVSVVQYGSGKLVCIGAYEVFRDSNMDNDGNKKFALNVFDWLCSSKIQKESQKKNDIAIKDDNESIIRLLKGIVSMIFDIDKKSDNMIDNIRKMHSRIDNIENDLSDFVETFNEFSQKISTITNQEDIPFVKNNNERSIEKLERESSLIKRDIHILQEKLHDILHKYEQGIINETQFKNEKNEIEHRIESLELILESIESVK